MSNWIHTINPFAVATRASKRKMLILISDHTSRLQAGVANLPLGWRPRQPTNTIDNQQIAVGRDANRGLKLLHINT